MSRRTIRLRLSAALVAEAIAIGALGRIDPHEPRSGAVATSPVAATDLLDAVTGSARWLAIALLSYLAAITALQLLALALGSVAVTSSVGARLSGFVARLGPRTIAGLAAAATVASATSACVPVVGARPTPAEPGRSPVVMVLESGPQSSQPDPTVTMSLEPDRGTATTIAPDPADEPPPATTNPADVEPAGTPSPATAPAVEDLWTGGVRTIVVAGGDSFWSIADHAVSTRLGRRATDDEIAPYWRLLVDINRSRLVDPDDPGRIYAGQRFVLP